MVFWTIYDHPRDYPEHFVVRAAETIAGEVRHRAECRLARTLDEARSLLPRNVTPMPLFAGDDPVILEVYAEVDDRA